MVEETPYTIASEAEPPSTALAELSAHKMSRSLFGRLGRPLVWIRPAKEDPRPSNATKRWRAFVEPPRFERMGDVRETFWCAPFSGSTHTFYQSPDGVIAALTRNTRSSSAAFYAVFEDGLILCTSTRGRFHAVKRNFDPEGWIQYGAGDDPEEAYEYFLAAIAHFESSGRRRVPLHDINNLVALRGEYWRRQPRLWDVIKLYGVLNMIWVVLPILLL